MKKMMKNLTSNLLLYLAITTQLTGMELENVPKLTWGQKGDIQKDNGTFTMQEDIFYTKSGLNFLHSQLDGKPESSSNYKALDIAGDRTQSQRKLKVTALLNAQHKPKEDPRGSLLQKVMCSPAALHNWHKKLSKKPSLYREGWSQEVDKGLACCLLAATKLRALLKNQYLMNENNQPIITRDVDYWGQTISPNQQYLFARVNNGDAALIDLTTQKELYSYTHIQDNFRRSVKGIEEVCEFSANNRFCFFIEKSNEKLNYQWTDICSMHAFDLKTKQLVKMPENVTVKQFSSNCAFAVLHKPENEPNQNYVQAIFDVKKQEIMTTYPCPDKYKDVSFSPNGRWCFLYTDKGLQLLDLENNCKEIDLHTKQLDGGCDNIIWNSNGSCLIAKEYSYHLDDTTLCQGCVQSVEPRENCPNGEIHESFYVLYDPASNKQLRVFEDALLAPPPSFSPDGRYCYLIQTNKRGHLYDLQENKTVKIFENVREDVYDEKQTSALFSKDPHYPYCIVPICNKNSQYYWWAPGLKVVVYDLEKQEEVPEVTNLENVFLAQWPAKGPYYFVNHCASSIKVREKGTHECVLQIDDAKLVHSSPDGSHCVISYYDEKVIIVDMASKKVLRKFDSGSIAGTFFKNGALYEEKHSTLRQVLPPDPDWSKITTQQILFMLYAYQRRQKHNFVDLTQEDEQPLCNLFESLDEYMQTYVARACKIKFTAA